MTSGSLWNYHRVEVIRNANENNADNYSINKNKPITSKSFEYKSKLIGGSPNDNNTLNAEVVVQLEYLSIFWRFLDFPFTKSETELDLSWSKECIKDKKENIKEYIKLLKFLLIQMLIYLILLFKQQQQPEQYFKWIKLNFMFQLLRCI